MEDFLGFLVVILSLLLWANTNRKAAASGLAMNNYTRR